MDPKVKKPTNTALKQNLKNEIKNRKIQAFKKIEASAHSIVLSTADKSKKLIENKKDEIEKLLFLQPPENKTETKEKILKTLDILFKEIEDTISSASEQITEFAFAGTTDAVQKFIGGTHNG